MSITTARLAAMIDHTNLRPDATKQDFVRLCEEARRYRFAMVAINPYPVAQCAELLRGTGVHVGAAIGFPLGQVTIEDKVSETRNAIAHGADEIDYVINITELKAGNLSYIEREMQAIVDVAGSSAVTTKVIFENCYLTDAEKRSVAEVAVRVRPDFVKTSTGFGSGGATLADVQLMKECVGDVVQVKAAGGIRTLDAALSFIAAGATRIGTSRGLDLIAQLEARSGL
ncbi:MAG: deoxyribose-phosphate aldolase [Actinomycetaceae bacterium]|nr:deoxyribose-phosphate aldolase [Actinomycetaceae bacterium]